CGTWNNSLSGHWMF
nr:immunoglobulin light chain junction region [Macaca mulatta]